MRQKLVFWMLNTILNRFNLNVSELGFFYNHKKSKAEYLISVDLDEALRFLKINKSFKNFMNQGLKKIFDDLENCPYYNKALFAIEDIQYLPKEYAENSAISFYIKKCRNQYLELQSNYKFSRSSLLYDFVLNYHYGNLIKNKISPKKTRELFVKNKINSEILREKLKLQNIKIAASLLDKYKEYITVNKKSIFEQYVIKTKQDIIIEEIKCLI